MKRPTIQDVARSAGISTSSVSNYLNGRHNHLRQETIERIEKSIAELNYAPSAVARQLKTGHTPMLGLLMPSVANPYHAELAQSLDAAAGQGGFRLILGNVHRDAEREKAFFEELVSYGVRAIIVTSELKNPSLIREYTRRGIAFVLFDLCTSELSTSGVDMVSIDNALATSMAVDHLHAHGHRKIAYVTSALVSAGRMARLAGYTDALARHGLGQPVVISKDADPTINCSDPDLAQFGQRVASQVAETQPRPTAVIAMNDILAVGLASGLRRLGLDVPGDISLVGIDDIQFASLMIPSLTTLRPDYLAMATQAIACVQSRLANRNLPSRQFIFPPVLIARESSAAPR